MPSKEPFSLAVHGGPLRVNDMDTVNLHEAMVRLAQAEGADLHALSHEALSWICTDHNKVSASRKIDRDFMPYSFDWVKLDAGRKAAWAEMGTRPEYLRVYNPSAMGIKPVAA